MNSDTPFTDSVVIKMPASGHYSAEIMPMVKAAHCQRLERERDAAYKAIREAVNKYGSLSFGYNGDCGADVIIGELDDFLSEHQPAP